MNRTNYVIKFEGQSLAGANRYADELRDSLLDAAADKLVDIDAHVQREDATTMDFGGTLILTLGTPAVAVIAKGIRDWLKRRNTASITIETADGKLIATNISAKDAANLADKFHVGDNN
jgi:hypothetical protein